MGMKGELFTTQVTLDKRSYFFNVKENRNNDVFLQIVESKTMRDAPAERLQIAIFEDDMQKFCKGLDDALSFMNKHRKNRQDKHTSDAHKKPGNNKKSFEQNEQHGEAKDSASLAIPTQKKTGKIHITSKKIPSSALPTPVELDGE